MSADSICLNLPESWRADRAVPKGEECSTCAWNGKWEDLLHRPPEMTIKLTRQQLQHSLETRASLYCAVLFALLGKSKVFQKASTFWIQQQVHSVS